jgi:hypothetical protein
MPIINNKTPSFRPRKSLEISWNEFRGGWNPLLRPTELKDNELAQADNIMLIGSGVPTSRWGTSQYFTANATGSIRGLGTYFSTVDDSINRLISLTDEGYLCYKDGTSFTRISGQSYPSGSIVRFEQLGGKTYIASKDRPLTQYDGSALTVFATVSAPTGLTATNISGVSGTQIYSWKVVTLSNSGGTSEGSSPITLPNLPFDLERSLVQISWSAPSAAASVITGYEVYRGTLGNERFLAGVGPSTTTYFDEGGALAEIATVPIINTTGGVKSEFVEKVNDRLLMVDASDPTKLMISARYPNQYKFSAVDGGGYIYVDPDSGQRITGIKAQPGSDKVIVFKEYSSFAVSLSTVTVGNYNLLDPQYQPVSTLVGCSSQDTIQVVENDIFYLGKKGVYVVGFEPNFLNLIRTNEVSARIRPYLDKLSGDDYKTAVSMYVDNKYIISFPSRKEMIVYDRERGCWIGPWILPFGISKMKKYTDSSNTEKWVLGSADNNKVYTFEKSVNSDDGQIIAKTLRTKKEYFGSWSILKIIKYFKILFRNITGSVDVNILLEDRNGQIQTIKTFTIEGSAIAGSSGWGIDGWGLAPYGITYGSVVITGDEFYRWTQLFKEGRILQIEVMSNSGNTNFELLGIDVDASQQSKGQLPASSRV